MSLAGLGWGVIGVVALAAGCTTIGDTSSVEETTVVAEDISEQLSEPEAASDIETLERELAELKAQGAPPETVAQAMWDLADAYELQGDGENRIRISQDAFDLVTGAFSERDPIIATAKVELAHSLLGYYSDLNTAEVLAQEALTLRKEILGERHPKTARAQILYGAVIATRGRLGEAVPYYQAAKDTLSAVEPEGDTLLTAVRNLATIHSMLRNIDVSADLFEEVLALYEGQDKTLTQGYGTAQSNYGNLLQRAGRYDAALRANQEALRVRQAVLGPGHPDTAQSLNQVGSVYTDAGRYAEAEQYFLQSLASLETRVNNSAHQIYPLSNLAFLYIDIGRPEEAIPLYQRTIEIEEANESAPHRLIPLRLGLAVAYRDTGQTDLAFSYLEEVLADALSGDDGLEPGSRLVATIKRQMGTTARHLEKLDVSAALLDDAVQIMSDIEGPDTTSVATARFHRGRTLQAQGQLEAALEDFEAAMKVYETALGPLAISSISAQAILAEAYLEYDEPDKAYSSAVAGLTGLEANLRVSAHAEGIISRSQRQRLEESLHTIRRVLLAVGQGDRSQYPASVAQAFTAAQLARSSSTSDAAREAVLIAQSDQAWADLVRSRRALVNEKYSVDKRYVGALAEGADQASELFEQAETLQAQIDQVSDRLRSDAPHIFDLISTQTVPLDQLTSRSSPLKEGEAVLMLSQSEEDLLVFLVTPGETFVETVSLTSGQTGALVSEIRASVDISDLAFVSDLPVFAQEASQKLYDRLVGPFSVPISRVETLYIVADGPLERLPFSLLGTASKTETGDFVWLSDQVALSHLPSVVSFAALRDAGFDPASVDTFLGVGDPALSGTHSDTDVRSFGRLRSAARQDAEGLDFSDAAAICLLAPLPDTRQELMAMGRIFGPDNADYLLGTEATEPALREMNTAKRLRDYDVIAFATHGLISSEADATHLVEPALVLSPPPDCNPQTTAEDGILTASEVASLDLAADWVILSACSTAAANPLDGAEPLSGLAKAFFHAGAESLLVSHWDIDSESTRDFMSLVFEGVDDGLTRSEALRSAQRQFRQSPPDDKPHYAHPAFWAPFALIGSAD